MKKSRILTFLQNFMKCACYACYGVWKTRQTVLRFAQNTHFKNPIFSGYLIPRYPKRSRIRPKLRSHLDRWQFFMTFRPNFHDSSPEKCHDTLNNSPYLLPFFHVFLLASKSFFSLHACFFRNNQSTRFEA